MNENQQPPNPDQPTPPTEPGQVVVFDHTPKPAKFAFLSQPKIIASGLAALFIVSGLAFYGHHMLSSRNAQIVKPAENIKQTVINTAADKNQEAAQVPTPTTAQPTTGQTTPTPTKTTTKQTTTTTPTVTTTPTPAPNTTNCLPPNPSKYATYYVSMTNSQYLQTNSYINTTKLYAALQFAGLLNTINTKQYVVLAMDDSIWSNFTQAQLDWMNASPANMRSVLGWQVITSCITWDGVNPVKNMAVGSTQTVTTLNGTVTYTHGTGGQGSFGNGKVGIWDWFTSNGSVTVAGFVNTTSIP
jgi:hypothetical protein